MGRGDNSPNRGYSLHFYMVTSNKQLYLFSYTGLLKLGIDFELIRKILWHNLIAFSISVK